MRYNKLKIIFLFVLASCSTEMDKDLEIAVNEGKFSDNYNELTGDYTGNDVLITATSVSAGTYHTCAVLSGGTVRCWGRGSYSQLGNGSTSNQTTPVSVSRISTATSVSAGTYHTCAVISGGTVK